MYDLLGRGVNVGLAYEMSCRRQKSYCEKRSRYIVSRDSDEMVSAGSWLRNAICKNSARDGTRGFDHIKIN